LITLTNPSTTVTLTDIQVCDDLCSFVTYADNANPAPASEPAVGGTGTICWSVASLGPGESLTFTFEATAVGQGTPCTADVTCTNVVRARGFCADAEATDTDTFNTVIPCVREGDNCPRTPGFWTAQCAQLPDGSAKFTPGEVAMIAECVDDQSDFFDWPAGTDFDRFCSTIVLPSDPTQREQAKRQFAVLLANLCTGLLGLTPNNGGIIGLDPTTPINCPGFSATTIGELIEEVDALLGVLEGQNLALSQVKQQYSRIIFCVDRLNNGIDIVQDRGRCDNGGTGGNASRIIDGNPAITLHEEVGSLELARPVPNPFSGSMSYSYRVPEGGNGRVDIGVYNVAGRLIAQLAHEEQVPGLYTVRWDGTSNGGIKVGPGVYFLRASISGTVTRSRVLYVTP
jgi:hypothetical protein